LILIVFVKYTVKYTVVPKQNALLPLLEL